MTKERSWVSPTDTQPILRSKPLPIPRSAPRLPANHSIPTLFGIGKVVKFSELLTAEFPNPLPWLYLVWSSLLELVFHEISKSFRRRPVALHLVPHSAVPDRPGLIQFRHL